MLEQDAVYIGCAANLAAHILDVQGRQLSVKGILDTGEVVSVMPVSTVTDMGFDRSDLSPANIRLAAANQGANYVTGKTPIISLQLGGRHLWMSFLVVKNLKRILKRISELKSSKNFFSMKSETDDGLSSCSNFPERPKETKLAANKPVMPEIEHLKAKYRIKKWTHSERC